MVKRNSKQPALIFEKSVARDWSLIFVQILHQGYTSEFKKQLGWSYTEIVFEGKNNAITIYRSEDEHINDMRDFILHEIDKDPLWMSEQSSMVKRQVKSIISWIEKTERKSLSEYSPEGLKKIIEMFIRKNLDLLPRYLTMLWFPIQMEDYKDGAKYKKAVKNAEEARVKIEKLVPIIDGFSRKIALAVLAMAELSPDFVRYVSIEEVSDYLNNDVAPKKKNLLKKRKYFIVTNKGVLFEPIESYLKKCGFKIKKENIGKVSEVKGQIAFPGTAKGKAKIIRNKDMFDMLNKGDILITPMTTPDFLPIMKKAAAFVTDEGGITCHAAIVAREIKKPCIIGTKIATEVIKDNDLVEVDANKGIVKILKENK